MSCVLLVAAHSAPLMAFRTAAELPAFGDAERVVWPTDRIPVLLHTSGAPGLSLEQTQAEVMAALDAWSAPSCSEFRFQFQGVTNQAAEREDGRNTIQWVTGWEALGFPLDAPGAADVQYAKDADGQWHIIEADLYLNAEHFDFAAGTMAGEGKQSVRNVVAHEAGHMLGLLHPCELGGENGAPTCEDDQRFATATMYPLYSDGAASLAADDLQGLCTLYPLGGCDSAACGGDEVCTASGCVAHCGGLVCAADEACHDGVCVSQPQCGAEGCPTACADSNECASGLVCTDGVCTEPQVSVAGDPCGASSDCRSGVCGSLGYCTSTCNTDDDCAHGSCSSEYGECVLNLAPFGATCAEANECAGNQCLAGSPVGGPFCTRQCQTGTLSCPNDWSCQTVEARDVCVPNHASPLAPTGGCSCSTPVRSRSRAELWLLVFAATTVVLRRRASRA